MGELETLNMLLRLIGSSPVNSLTTTHPDAANAKATMQRISRKVQRKGWWFNIDYNVILSPDQTGVIKLASTISSVVFEDPQYIQRGDVVYDKYNQTGIFTTGLTAKRTTTILDWDEMPAVMQEYCAYYAGSEFVRDELEDPQKEASLRETASASYLDVKKQELEEGQYNIFNKERVIRARGGIRPYSRGNKRFYGDPDV